MKKLAFISSLTLPFLAVPKVFADSIIINQPQNTGFRSVGDFISNALLLALAFGALMVLIMILWGAFEWITSGGDKEAVGKARNRILNAIIGLAILAAAFAIARLIGAFTGLQLGNLSIPTPNPYASGL